MPTSLLSAREAYRLHDVLEERLLDAKAYLSSRRDDRLPTARRPYEGMPADELFGEVEAYLHTVDWVSRDPKVRYDLQLLGDWSFEYQGQTRGRIHWPRSSRSVWNRIATLEAHTRAFDDLLAQAVEQAKELGKSPRTRAIEALAAEVEALRVRFDAARTPEALAELTGPWLTLHAELRRLEEGADD
jgi:hypothetical protein